MRILDSLEERMEKIFVILLFELVWQSLVYRISYFFPVFIFLISSVTKNNPLEFTMQI